MVQPLPAGYAFDPADPRAPTMEQWDRMSPAERDYVRELLPSEGTFDFPDGTRVRIFDGAAVLEDLDETIARLGVLVDQSLAAKEELGRALEEERRLREEAERGREEADRALAEARAEIERLKGR
jgi:hypothetical protein